MFALLGFLIAVYATGSCSGEPSTCLSVYKEGGAPAVFRSPECPRWNLRSYDSPLLTTTAAAGGSICQSAMLQGRRKYQEDSTLCALDILITFPGETGLREVMVGIVAIFDGHNGAEASEMASKLLLEYFALHTYFLLDAACSFVLKKSTGRLPSEGVEDAILEVLNWDEELGQHELNFDRSKFSLPEKVDDSFHFKVLKEALLRTIHDIDAIFSKEASRKNLVSGSTANIVMIVDGQILVTNIGDSKALLCSEKFQSPAEARATLLRLRRQRRCNGALSPKRYHDNIKLITSEGLAHFIVKELTRDHHPDRDDEKFRVETAGGYVHEWGGVPRVNGQLAVSRSIGDMYFKSYGVISAPEVTDWQPLTKNDSYLVVASDGMFEKLSLQDACDLLWEVHSYGTERSELSSSCSHSLAECLVNTAFEKGSMDNIATVVVPLRSIGIHQRLVRERCIGEENMHCSSRRLRLSMRGHSEKKETKAVKGMIKINNANILGLPDSVPFGAGSNNGSTEHAVPDSRYVLKKRIGRGSYGEAWLGFHWNCHKGSNASSPAGKNENRRKSEKGTTHDCNIDPDDNLFVLKRIMVERGAAVYLSGLREKYFGEVFLNASRCLDGLISDGNIASQDEWESSFDELLETNESIHGLAKSWNSEHVLPNKFRLQRAVSEEGLNHIARYVESFESRSKELWLVFRHEGLSLSKLMCTAEEIENTGAEEKNEEVKNVHVLHPSKWWRWLKTTEAGKEEMRNLIWQLLIALKSCHDRNINHRDIKPANLVICFEDLDTGRCWKGGPSGYKNYTTKMRIIDFGSAMDEFSLKHYYESTGPSRAEQTYDYAPPEALLNASWYKGPEGSNLKYDMWSVGVIILELILGSPNVFQISPLTQVLLDPYIEGWNEDFKELAYKLKSFMELCILVSGSSSKHHHSMGQIQGGTSLASWRCSEEFFSQQIKIRDPLKLGFPNVWALRFVRQLLLWNPEDRLSVDDALLHPYFQHPAKR